MIIAPRNRFFKFNLFIFRSCRLYLQKQSPIPFFISKRDNIKPNPKRTQLNLGKKVKLHSDIMNEKKNVVCFFGFLSASFYNNFLCSIFQTLAETARGKRSK